MYAINESFGIAKMVSNDSKDTTKLVSYCLLSHNKLENTETKNWTTPYYFNEFFGLT